MSPAMVGQVKTLVLYFDPGVPLPSTPMEPDDRLEDLAATLRQFAAARDWDQFHTPKNLVMALSAETGELVQVFQWLSLEEAEAVMASDGDKVRDELADVLIYLVRLADVLDVDLVEAAEQKIRANEQRYPVDLARGNARKYSDLRDE